MHITPVPHKISVPGLFSTILHRKALVQTLTNAIEPHDSDWPSPYKLVLLCAVAGYGKTTLLIDTVHHLSKICCWYTLDQSDADPAVFIQRLLASLQRSFPTFGKQLVAQFEAGLLSTENDSAVTGAIEIFLDTLKNEITQPFVLILSNYHEVNTNQTMNKLVDRLIANLSPQSLIVIESQAIPDLTLAPLIARHQMFGMGHQNLRFTAQEIYDLAQLQGLTSFSFDEAEQLANTFDGWIAGILLGSRMGYAQFGHSTPETQGWGNPALKGNSSQTLAYITNEVFKNETSTYEFLKKTSILTRLNADHCNKILQIGDAAERLTYAEQRGLFVVRDRENEDARLAKDYICHPVLRQLFVNYLQQEMLEDYRLLHSQAARILQADHQYEQALAHAYEAQEYHLAAHFLIEQTSSIIYEEQSETILRWIKMLPEAIFNAYPQLLLMVSNIYLHAGEFALVSPLLDTTEALLQTLSEQENQRTYVIRQAELAIARGHLSFFQGEFERTQEYCQQALKFLPADERRLHIRAYQYMGIALIVGAGKAQEGITQLQRALQISRSQKNERQIATLNRLVANAYSWIGNHPLAEHHQMRAFQIWEKLHNTHGIIYSLTSMGLLKMRQGFTQEAEDLLFQAHAQAREISHFKSGEAYVLVGLGDLYNNLGRYADALKYLEDGLGLAYTCEDHYLICCSLCYMALTYLFLGDAQTASFFLNQVVIKEGETLSFEGCLFYLTQGSIYLAQQDYRQAEALLIRASDTARRANIQIIYISTLLCLAVCYLRQNKKRTALQIYQNIIDLNKQRDFDFFLAVAFRRYVDLEKLQDQALHADQMEMEDEASSIELPPLKKPAKTVEIQGEQANFAFQILALGEPQVISHGVPVTRWRMARTMELFFFLLEVGHPVRKDHIIDALWSEHDNKQIASTVRTIIYYLRKALGNNSIIFQSGMYSLNSAEFGNGSIWYDVDVFNAQYTLAKKALEAKDDDVAATTFNNMLRLYNGDYVQSFYNDWCILRRDKLQQAYMDAHHQLALIAWRREDWDNSLQHWQHLLELDSCNETAHYGIMRCYLQQSKRELALRQFQFCNQVLQEELQASPRAAIQKLYQSIIS